MLHQYPIVGAFYRPPAKAILAAIPVTQRLYLAAEPDNHVDPNAIAVYIKLDDIALDRHAGLDNEMAQHGYDMARLRAEGDTRHLGYIPAGLAKALRSDDSIALNTEYEGEFACDGRGSPFIRFDLP